MGPSWTDAEGAWQMRYFRLAHKINELRSRYLATPSCGEPFWLLELL